MRTRLCAIAAAANVLWAGGGAAPGLAAPRDFSSTAKQEGSLLRIAIEYPEAGQEIAAAEPKGFITGTAFQAREMVDELDVYVVIDVSGSTVRPSGADIDGDGRIGTEGRARRFPILGAFMSSASDDPGDSVLACEVQAAKTLLGQLDSASTRVGIIAFSGSRLMTRDQPPDARIVAPLTREYDTLVQKLDELESKGPSGETNLVAAVQVATLEFERDFLANRARKVQRLALLISDGRATLPIRLKPDERQSEAVEAAKDAAQVSAVFYTYAVGEDDPVAVQTLSDIAKETKGIFERVAEPADLVARFQELDLAKIDQLTVKNLTLDKDSSDVLVDAYGTFSAIIPLAEGENSIEVFARSTTGAEKRERVSVTYRRDQAIATLPVRALERRGKLLEEKLREAYVEDIKRVREGRGRGRDRSVDVTTEPERKDSKPE
jgi:hypothetical protein